jgi:transposase
MNSSYQHYAGIDVSKSCLDVHLLPDDTAARFPNNASGHRAMVKLLHQNQVLLTVIEATGGYEQPALVAMVCAGLKVHLAQPQVVHAFARSLKLRAKNDQIDARTCARYAMDRAQDLRVIEKIDPTLQALQALVVRRDQLLTMQTMEKNRLQQAPDQTTRASIKRMLRWLDNEITRIEKQIDKTIEADETLQAKSRKLQQTKGVGPQTARLLLAMLPELGRVDIKRLNALVGVAPFAADSGQHRGTRRIAGGRTLVRNGLYMACMSASQSNPVIAGYYQRLTSEGNLPHKSAMMACIRKLLAHLDRELRTLLGQLVTTSTTAPAAIAQAVA